MHYAILAGGQGSRMKSIGPKPLVEIEGKTLVQRMLEVIGRRADVDSVSVIANCEIPEIERHLRSLRLPMDLHIVPACPPTGSHSLKWVTEHIPEGEKVVALTVDTFFRPEEFDAYVDLFASLPERTDALMAVTHYIDDEKPLYVKVAPGGRILAFSDLASDGIDCVSAGIYGLGSRALDVLRRGVDMGVNGLREFQRSLLVAGLNVHARDIGKAFDVDRPEDLESAREFLRCQA